MVYNADLEHEDRIVIDHSKYPPVQRVPTTNTNVREENQNNAGSVTKPPTKKSTQEIIPTQLAMLLITS